MKRREVTARGCGLLAGVPSYAAMLGSRLKSCGPKSWRFTSWSLKSWSWIVGALLLCCYFAENAIGERTGLTALLLYLPQHGWGLLPLSMLVWTLRRKQWRLAWLNGAFLGFWAHFLLGLGSFAWAADGGYSHKSRLMTYNIERGAGGIDALEAAIRAQHPDILCLQESQGIYKKQSFDAGAALATRFPHWNAAQSGDVMTLSRFPISSQRSFPLRGTRRVLETTIDTPLGPLRVLNVHVATSFAKQPYTPHDFLGRIGKIVREAQPAAQTRLKQIAPLRAAIENGPAQVPLLVAGDFNSPSRGLFLGAISRGLDDAWRFGSGGTGATFPANFPVLPIDHVLSRGLFIDRAQVGDARASDHRALIVDFWS